MIIPNMLYQPTCFINYNKDLLIDKEIYFFELLFWLHLVFFIGCYKYKSLSKC